MLKTFKLETFKERLSQKSAVEVNQVDCEIFGLENITAETGIIFIVKKIWQAELITCASKGYNPAVAFSLTAENFNSALNKMLACLKRIKLAYELPPRVLWLYEYEETENPLVPKFLDELRENGCLAEFNFFSKDFNSIVLEQGAESLKLEINQLYSSAFTK